MAMRKTKSGHDRLRFQRWLLGIKDLSKYILAILFLSLLLRGIIGTFAFSKCA